MSITSRIIGLETLYEIAKKDSPPQPWEAHNAFGRRCSRARRLLRAGLERYIAEMTELRPPPFDQELEDVLGLPELDGISPWGSGSFEPGGLWEPSGIRKEDCLLRGDFGTEQQEHRDEDICRRWSLALGVDAPPSANDIHEMGEKIAAGLDRLRHWLEIDGEGRGPVAMAKCSVIKATGQPCKGEAISGKTYCWSHDPANSETRRRTASRAGKRGGRGRPAVDLSDIKSQLAGMLAGVLSGRIPTNIAAVANQIQNSRLRVVEVERKLRETDELIERIEALEAAAQAQSGAPQTGSAYNGNGYKSFRGVTRQ
jgi:hypothetical protein